MSTAPYPHVSIGVRDDSIYTPTITEILPLNKPLYMMRAQKGPIGVPVWCESYTVAARVFGEDTFNKRSKYFSEQAYFLLKTLPSNGAFIMRVADDTASLAKVTFQLGVSKEEVNIKQWLRDGNGRFVLELDGSKIPVKAGETGEAVEVDPEDLVGGEPKATQATIKGKKLVWRAVQSVKITDETTDSNAFTWYPMIDIVAENPGEWGEKFGLKLVFDESSNSVGGTIGNGAVTYTLAPVQLIGDDVTPTAITDAYGQTSVSGVVRPDVVDPDSGVDLTIDKRLVGSYSGKQSLPIKVTIHSKNWAIVGKQLMEAELKAREAVGKLYGKVMSDWLITDADGKVTIDGDDVNKYSVQLFVDKVLDKLATAADVDVETGYMANVVDCRDPGNTPYFASCVVGATDPDVDADERVEVAKVQLADSSSPFYLGGGTDGVITDIAVEKMIRKQIEAVIGQTQEYLIDYARCPFNAIYDTGVSVATKKSYLSLLSARDSVVVNVTPQQIWKKQDETKPGVLSRFDDESIGSALRAYAWLMKEDVINGTEACRAKIFLHTGYTADHDGPVASTLWQAIRDAQYLNRDYIAKEAKELPNSDVDTWTSLSWTANSEDTRSRCWNAGLNYVQYYTMKNYHYASVRTVYRYETSILVDAGVVNAMTFMKDIIRRSWATFAGSTRPAAELNLAITEDLQERFSYMLNGKYAFSVNVYQTDEDVKLGYARHVDVELIAPGTNRVWQATIICRREGFTAE